jgi:hypothetical protein
MVRARRCGGASHMLLLLRCHTSEVPVLRAVPPPVAGGAGGWVLPLAAGCQPQKAPAPASMAGLLLGASHKVRFARGHNDAALRCVRAPLRLSPLEHIR